MQTESTRNPSMPVWNRESIIELLTRELARSESSGSNLLVILVRVAAAAPNDINLEARESQSNFVFGEIAYRLSRVVRRYDYIGRYSSNQFLILAPGWEQSKAHSLAETLREAVSESHVDVSGRRIRATLSLVPANSADFKSGDQQAVLEQLEEALDRAEANGGNRV